MSDSSLKNEQKIEDLNVYTKKKKHFCYYPKKKNLDL